MEAWRPVPGYDGMYFVSNHGRVRSMQTWRGHAGPREMTQSIQGGMHRYVRIRHEGHPSKRYVHQLVALTFLGPCPMGMEVCHNDGDPTNNRPENLRYGTRSENNLDQLLHVVKDNPHRVEYCKKGLHPFDSENTYLRRNGRRMCRACTRVREVRAGRRRAA